MLLLAQPGRAGLTFVTNNQTFFYTLNVTNSTAVVTGYSGTISFIPATMNGVPLGAIGDGAFSYSSLASVTVPESVTVIGSEALTGSSLTSVILGTNLLSIGSRAFLLVGLTNVTIPDSVTNLGYGAFAECFGLTNVFLGGGLQSLDLSVFSFCESLEAINVSAENPSYSSVAGVLFNQDRTTLIEYPAGRSGTIYAIPASVTDIGDSAFLESSQLQQVSIPGTVAVIETLAFESCALTSVSIPDSVTNIGWEAFESCTDLMDVMIGSGLTNWDQSVFDSCTSLAAIHVSSNNPVFSSVEGVLFNRSQTTLIAYPCAKPGNAYTIPGTVTNIAGSAFAGCTNLTNVTLPEGVTSIGGAAFLGCTGLTNLILPEDVISIGDEAFWDCTGLTNLTIPDSVTSIGEYVFWGCTGLITATIGNGVTYLGPDAFGDCFNIKGFYFRGNAPTLGSTVFQYDHGTVYYASENTGWSNGYGGLATATWTLPEVLAQFDFATNNGAISILRYVGAGGTAAIPPLLNGWPVMTIGNGAFASSPITQVEMAATLTNLGAGAFANCPDLTSITLWPTQSCVLASGVFSNCTALTNALIGGAIADLGAGVFAGCTGLAGVELEATVTNLPDLAFAGCTNLPTIQFPASLLSVGAQALAGCSGLGGVVVPYQVESIGPAAFSNCTDLA